MAFLKTTPSASELYSYLVGSPDDTPLDFDQDELSQGDLEELYDLMWEEEVEEQEEKPSPAPVPSAFSTVLASLTSTGCGPNECSICFCEFSDLVTELACGHRFCSSCVETYLQLTLARQPALYHKRSFVRRDGIAICVSQRELIGVVCPHFACLGVIEAPKIRSLADAASYQKFEELGLYEQMLRMERRKEIRRCLFGCGSFLQNDCLCPTPSCREKQLQLRDRERKKLLKLMLENDLRLERWAAAHPDLVRLCPLCSTQIEKNGGCDHMYCTSCKQAFLWSKALPFRSATHWLAKQKEEFKKKQQRLAEVGLFFPELPLVS